MSMADAIAAGRERHTAALTDAYPGELTYNGATYPGGALFIGGLERHPAANGSGWITLQRFSLSVRKDLMETPPPAAALFTSAGLTWKVDGEVGGQNPLHPAWIIRGVRYLSST